MVSLSQQCRPHNDSSKRMIDVFFKYRFNLLLFCSVVERGLRRLICKFELRMFMNSWKGIYVLCRGGLYKYTWNIHKELPESEQKNVDHTVIPCSQSSISKCNGRGLRPTLDCNWIFLMLFFFVWQHLQNLVTKKYLDKTAAFNIFYFSII